MAWSSAKGWIVDGWSMAAAAAATLAIDGSNSVAQASASSVNIALTTTGGSGTIVVIGNTSSTVSGVPTASGLTFVARAGTPFNDPSFSQQIFYYTAPYSTNFSGNITVNFAGATQGQVCVFGISAATAFDSNGSIPQLNNAGGNASGTTNGANDLVFAYYIGTGNMTLPGGWTVLIDDNANFGHVGYIIGGPATYTATYGGGGASFGSVLDALH